MTESTMYLRSNRSLITSDITKMAKLKRHTNNTIDDKTNNKHRHCFNLHQNVLQLANSCQRLEKCMGGHKYFK